MSAQKLVTLATLAGVMAACSAGGGGGGRGGSGNGGAGGGSGGNGGGDPTATCGTSKVGTPKLRRLSRRELSRTLEDVFPEAKGQWTLELSADPVSHYGFDNDAAVLVVGKQTAREIASSAASVASAITGSALSTLLPCAASAVDAACAGEFVSKYGKRLFRRPVTAEEQQRYVDFFTQASAKVDGKSALAWTARALIQSPHTLYRREIGAAESGKVKLSQHEVATALSYTFAGTTPSDELLGQADRGELKTADQLVTAAKALLTGPGKSTVHQFFDSWLGYGRVTSIQKNDAVGFEAVRDQMAEETRRFIEEVVFTRGGSAHELLTAPYSTPSSALATFYGFPAPAADYAVSDRPAGRGIGILAQGSLLASQAQPLHSSPTKRGLLVYERFLCQEKPIVPADVPTISKPAPGEQTTRQKYEESHASIEPCKGCHAAFDPIGFGFENFDEAGRYRDMDNGFPVNAASQFASGTTKLEFTNQEELARALAEEDVVHECISGLVTTFAYGTTEACLGETRRGEFVEGKVGFIDYLASLAGEPHFTQRQNP
jgi:hypothetical protein